MIASGIEIECLPPFKILYNLPQGTKLCILIGSRGGAKTYETSKFIAKSATIDQKRCAILRDEKSKIKQSILNEIKLRYETANKHGHLDLFYEKQENSIKRLSDGTDVVFTMGFRSSDNTKVAGLKSVSDVDIAVIEEAEDIRNVSKFNAFADGIRKQGYLIMVILNTPDVHHWIVKRYFRALPARGKDGNILDGYFELQPINHKGVVVIQTSYKDNPFLPSEKIEDYEGYGDPSHPNYDLHHYYTSILGYASTGRKGQILQKVKPISLKDYLALPFREVYGQDFGTASPAGLVGVKFDKNNVYARQLNYLPKTTLGLGKMYCTLGFGDRDRIIADSAEPKTISTLSDGYTRKELPEEEFRKYPRLAKGFFIEPCGKKDITATIGLMTSMNIHVVTESVDFWNEIYNWVYDVDKNGNPTDEPIDDFNHLIDPLGYVIVKIKTGGDGKFGARKVN